MPFDFPDSTHQTCIAVTALPNQDLATAERIPKENLCSFPALNFPTQIVKNPLERVSDATILPESTKIQFQ